MEEETESSLLRRQLQMIVVQHLNAGKKVDSALDFSLNFTIAQERFSVLSPEVAQRFLLRSNIMTVKTVIKR